jgi:hypothetical protein
VRGTTRWSAALLAGVLVLAGCGGDDDAPQAIEPTSEPTEEPEEPEAPEPEEPDEPEDPYAIPDDIDVAYVQSVVDVIVGVPDEPLLEAYRTAPHSLAPQPVIDALRATRSPEEAATSFALYSDWLADEEIAAAEAAFLEDAPPLRWEVLDVEVGREDCIVARFAFPEGADVPEGRTTLIRSPDDGRDPGGLNPTPWLIDRTGPSDSLTTEELEERCGIDQFAELEEEADVGDEADGTDDATGADAGDEST